MKKIYKLFLMTAIVFGMVACSNDDVPQTPESLKGSTYASISVALPGGPSTRAGLTETWEGDDLIETVDVFLLNESLGTVDYSSFNRDSFTGITDGKLNPTLAVKATPGQSVKAYVILNIKAPIKNDLITATASPATFAAEYAKAIKKNASDLASNNGTNDIIMMTNSGKYDDVKGVVIEPNITEAEAIKPTSVNLIKVNVDRVVSRAIVTIPEKTFTIDVLDSKGTDGSGSKITIVDTKYVVGQSNANFFLMQKADNVTPDPLYKFTPTAGSWNATIITENGMDNSGLAAASLAKVQNADGGKALSEFSVALALEKEQRKFVLPVTHADGNYKKGNTTYFEVQASFTPNSVDGTETYSPGTTVYLGMNDGKFYTSRDKAEAVGSQKATEYKGDGNTTNGGAIMKYVLWLNPDVIPGTEGKKAKMSPTVRNQVYHAHITGFKQIGLPNNPLNPSDPTDPLNPPSPIKPEDPLQTEETYLSVQITVVPWGVHSYEINLGNDY